MTIGDHVRLHINPGRREALDVPEEVGTIRAIDTSSDRVAVLVHFDNVSVYLSPFADGEVEIVSTPS